MAQTVQQSVAQNLGTMQVGNKQVPLTNVVNQIQTDGNNLQQQTNVTRGELQTFLTIMGKKFATLKANPAQTVIQKPAGVPVVVVAKPAAKPFAKAAAKAPLRVNVRTMPGPKLPPKPRAVTMTTGGPGLQFQSPTSGRTFPGMQQPQTIIGRQTQNGATQSPKSVGSNRIFPMPMHQPLVMPRQTLQINAMAPNARIFPTPTGLAVITPHDDSERQMSMITNPYYARGLSYAGMSSDQSIKNSRARLARFRRLRRKNN